MPTIVLFILIFYTLVSCLVKCGIALWKGESCYKKIQQVSRRALRTTLWWFLALGAVFLFLFNFEVFSKIGHALLPKHTIVIVRRLLHAIFETTSVFKASQAVLYFALLIFEFSLVFACVGLSVTKVMVIFKQLKWTRLGKSVANGRVEKVEAPRVERRLFLGFANLRI